MGYYAGTQYTEIHLAKENFAEIERRFQVLMDSKHPYGKVTWRKYKYGNSAGLPPSYGESNVDITTSYYETESKSFVVDDIFNTFGFMYTENPNGDIIYISYPDTSYDNTSVDTFLTLLEGLVAEGNFLEWLGSSGDDDRWMQYHHDGKWTQHSGVFTVTYPSKDRMLTGDTKYIRYLGG